MATSVTPASLIVHQVDAFLSQAPGLRDGSVTAFHDARVATRRMRELLPFAAAYFTPATLEDVENILKNATRRLGRVRDADVNIELMRAFQGAAPEAAVDVGLALGEWMRIRERRTRRAIKALERLDIDRVLHDVRLALTQHAPRLIGLRRRASAVEMWEDLLDARLRERAGELKASVAHAGGVMFSNRLHGARIAAKKLRYVMEIAAATGHAHFRDELRVLKKSQELLGSLHDHDVLADALRAAGAGAVQLLPMIDLHRRRLHARYVRRRDAILDVCEAAVRAATRDHRSMLARRAALAGALPLAVLALPLVRRRFA